MVNGNGSRPLTSVAHEILRQFGVLHASNACGGGVGGFGGSWPPDQLGYLDGIGLNTTSEPYTFIANGLNGFIDTYAFMSYCAQVGNGDPNDWVSSRNWQQLVSTFGITCNACTLCMPDR